MVSHIELYNISMFIAFIFFSPEMIFIPKHIEYNYHHYSFIRTALAQNTTIALSVM